MIVFGYLFEYVIRIVCYWKWKLNLYLNLYLNHNQSQSGADLKTEVQMPRVGSMEKAMTADKDELAGGVVIHGLPIMSWVQLNS